MKMTDDVMNDLLTLYLAGEASADTKALIESHARQHRRVCVENRGGRSAGADQDAAQRPAQ